MHNILVLGAGMSSSTLIKYLLDHSESHQWTVTVGDKSKALAEKKVNGHKNGKAIAFDVFVDEEKQKAIADADVIISMLPARFHYLVANECVNQKKHMVTASYVSKEVKLLDDSAKAAGIAMLNELGVDPGIDHMSAMKVIDEIRDKGGKILSFKSSTGGLVAPEFDNNPWNYKFTWNPRNVVVAGQGVSQYIQNGRLKYIPYHQLFKRTEPTSVLDAGDFEIYANRDSLKYREIYGLNGIRTIFRGTMRRPGYCKAWDVLVQLGMTDDTYVMEDTDKMTYRDFTNTFLPYNESKSVEEKVCDLMQLKCDSETMKRITWLGLFDKIPVDMQDATPAQILQQRLEEKWKLKEGDRDMIVMQHKFVYELDGEKKEVTSSMVVHGKEAPHTAMSITVGTPVAIATKLLLNGDIDVKGVHVPTKKDIYLPILEELEESGIRFVEEEKAL